MLNIPIFRAKASEKVWGGGVEKGDYVIGYFFQEARDNEDKCFYDYVFYIKQTYGDHFQDIEVDITTLAIHFPDMLDSQGNKIFASLSEDGKGGDIMKDDEYYGIAKYKDSRFVVEYENVEECLYEGNYEIIGIQQ